MKGMVHLGFHLIELLSVLLFFLFLGCDDIFEVDLTKQKVKLIAPGDSLVTTYNTQTFYWEDLKGATSYNLIVVSPSFRQIEQLVADTNVLGHKFTLNLSPGKYEWKVIAKNGSSKTDSFFIWRVQIDTTSNLSNQNVSLILPANGIASKGKGLTFRWQQVYSATVYEFQIGKPDLQNPILDSTLTNSTSITINDSLADGNYTWGVKAKNSGTSTVFSSRTILIDGTRPAVPALTEPTDKKVLSDKKVKFLWNRPTSDGGSKLYDDIYISKDSNSLVQFDMNQVDKFEVDTIGLYYTFTVDTSYFWRIVTFDAAGNRSSPSDIRKFIIKTQ
jgi:hypothetical protein